MRGGRVEHNIDRDRVTELELDIEIELYMYTYASISICFSTVRYMTLLVLFLLLKCTCPAPSLLPLPPLLPDVGTPPDPRCTPPVNGIGYFFGPFLSATTTMHQSVFVIRRVYQYAGWLRAMLVMLWDRIGIEEQICLVLSCLV